MREERTEYFAILTEKQPYEATEAIRIRLSQAKLVNKDFYSLFRDVAELKKHYAQQLRKIIAENGDLDAILKRQMLDNQVLTSEEMSNFKFNSLGELNDLWSTIVGELKTDLESSTQFQKLLEHQIVKTLKETTETDRNWAESKRLHSKLSRIAADIDMYSKDQGQQDRLEQANSQWASEVPYLVEVFETLDYNRLQTLKDCLLAFQTGFGDYLLNNTKSSENVMAKFLEFDPKDEISRFARDASTSNFLLSDNYGTNQRAETHNDYSNQTKTARHNASPSHDKRKSTFAQIGSRFTSASTVLHHDLMNNEFSDSGNNMSLKDKKSSHGLKSRVGSIFGKKLLNKNKRPQSVTNDSISELPSSNSARHSQGNTSSQYNLGGDHARPRSSSRPYSMQRNNSSSTAGTPFAEVDEPSQPVKDEPKFAVRSSIPASPVRNSPSNRFSLNQPPLQPQQRPAPLANEPQLNQGLSPVAPLPENPQFGHAVEGNKPLHIQAPAIPPSRKHTVSNRLPPGQLSTTSSVPQLQHAPSALSSQVTGELRELNPQATGSSQSLNGQSLFQHSVSNGTSIGLNASVAEVINATFKEGVLRDSQLIGEIALSYVPNTTMNNPVPVGINMKINNGVKFDKIMLNHAFVEQVEKESFKVNPQFIDNRTLGAVKYSVNEPLAPVVVHPVWKFEPHQSSVVLTVKMAPFVPERVKQLVLEDFVVFASIEGANVDSALSKPQGSFNKERKRITWKFTQPLVLTRESGGERLIARFITDGLAKESAKGVVIKYSIREHEGENISVGSGISLEAQELDVENPFGGDWKKVHTNTTLAAGNYIGLA
ncbi:Syp1p KNAG_0C02270 [Huiozyma naganishii CBS 8797]|uniref:MHD domain-containing protein n=1 Tax=Huiozyma naganishii (strain ATCC MYA-139 / BCRC 22969 / CBS 8797 / KCTC 17520 / NBRC 10181 / NCYC 3082 / Yp74L-3) TaxID=1071383 RepID=J7RII4_HUIN7|nr:hypothetical protein KNAG_0C02270 [Kazachstania naganishii CBS 8797]CCK69338.1 hypothetical protein KNAG_0C02270 [Kazachstania naganishii CBS 8797]